MSTVEPRLPAPPVSTTDVLKAFALLLILVDHVGHFLLDQWPILRVIGRLGVPIFFFFIGFSQSRDVPWKWLVLGLILTGVDYLWTGSLSGSQLNILFNFALIRLGLPFLERVLDRSLGKLLAILTFGALLVPLVNPWLEYGVEGWLFAVFGLLHRRVIAEGPAWMRARDMAGVFAFLVFALVERHDYAFNATMSALLVLGLIGIAGILRGFRRGDSPIQPPAGLRPFFRFCGRYSLELYAAQILLLAALGALWSIPGGLTGTGDTHD